MLLASNFKAAELHNNQCFDSAHTFRARPLIACVSHLLPQACSTKWISLSHVAVLHFFMLNIPVVIIS